MREIAVVFDPERKLFLYGGNALLAILVGPFGTYEAMTFWQRAMFWSLDLMGGMGIIVPILHVFYFSRLMRFIPSWPRFGLGVALGALPAAGFITILYGTVGAELEISTPFPLLYVQVTVFSAALLITEFVLWPAVFGSSGRAALKSSFPGAVPSPITEPLPPKSAPTPQPPALLGRLPAAHRGSEIISISMQDHYAEVTTSVGKSMLLMRLGDAIDLLEGCPGARIHRSHWVAQSAVEGIARDGRRMEVVLRDGRRLPIGNTYLNAARAQFGGAQAEDA